eukprot:Em0018g552a
MEQLLESLETKAQLSASDAVTLLKYIQEYASPIVSTRTSATTAASDRPGSRGRTKGNHRSKTYERNSAEQKRYTSPVGTPKQSPVVEGAKPTGGFVDLNSLDQFPPPSSNPLPRKQEASRQNVRRITPTPVTSPSTVQEFSSPNTSWKSNPAFTSHSALYDSPIPINEERKLLREELTHQKQRKGRSPRDANHSSSPWQQYSPGNSSDSRSMKLEPRRLTDSKDTCQVPVRRLSDGKDACYGPRGSSSAVSLESPSARRTVEGSPPTVGHPSQRSSPHAGAVHPSLTPSPHGHAKYPSQSPSSIYGGILPSPGTPASPSQEYNQCGLQHSSLACSSLSPSPCRAGGSDTLSPSPCRAGGSDRMNSVVGSPWSTAPSPALLPVPTQWTASPSRISEAEQKLLVSLASLYARLIIERVVPNPTTEIYFLVQLLTTSATCVPTRHDVLSGGVEGSSDSCTLFTTVDSCIFFSVTALNKIRVFLSALDKSTLRLLSENVRVNGFSPELAAFCSQLQESKSEQIAGNMARRLDVGSVAVPFQEDTDNAKNFANMKAFHAFKRQRDGFYGVMREWEKNRLNLDWNIQELLGDTIRGLVRQMPHGYSQTHFARLFQSQLLESCTQSNGSGALSLGGCVPDHMKDVDFNKLLRLSGRFQQPSSGAGPCPPPIFNEIEGFFSEFIAIADSYIFNEHLKDSLSEELTKLHLKCEGLEPMTVPDLLLKVRVIGKFLGYLVFLPYWSQFGGPQPRVNRSLSRPLDVLQCVKEACAKGHLCLTIPWVVQYLSMMDSLALHTDYYKTLLHTLINIYRTIRLDSDSAYYSSMLVLCCLGWLFETSNITEHVFFDCLKDMSVLPDSTTETQNKLDITEDVMYLCCPFLGEIRLLLAEFAVGLSRPMSLRKIKPVSADGDLSSKDKLAKKLKVQLVEAFFKSQQSFMKQLCELVSDRVAATAVAHMDSVILANHIGLGVKTLAQWLKCRLTYSSKDLDPVEMERTQFQVCEQMVQSVSITAFEFYASYCKEQTKKALEPLLQWTVHVQVLTLASHISVMWAEEKCMKWLERQKANLQEEVLKRFEKLRHSIRNGTELIDIAEGTQSCFPDRPVLVYSQHGPFQLDKMVGDLQLARCDPSKAHLEKICAHLRDAHGILAGCASATGMCSSELLPNDSVEVLGWTMDVAICLVQYGCLASSPFTEADMEGEVLNCLVQLWRDFKEFKMEVQLEKIMNATNFAIYLSQHRKGYLVWYTLGYLLVKAIHSDIFTTPIVEALWLCRRHQLNVIETAELKTAATIFLATWYSHKEALGSELQENSVFSEVHFVRLLCYVLQGQEQATIPISVLSFSFICEIVHPF